MEDRLTPATRFVVPIGVPVDNVNTFTSLSVALTTSGLGTGDTIQIEPGSAPGNVTNADFNAAFTSATALTIQGSTSAPASLLPQFTISDATTIAATRTLNLTGVNVGLVAAGAVTFSGNTTIANSILVDSNSTSLIPFTFAGTADNLTNSTVINAVGVSNTVVLIATNAVGTSHTISENTFVSHGITNCRLAWDTRSNVPVTDLLTNNTFTTNNGAATTFAIVIQESISGLTIQNNRISGPVGTGIYSDVANTGFRGFTAAGTVTAAAITTDSTTGAMFAQRNIFSVVDPHTVIYRSATGTVSTSGQLTGNAAFVQTLYTQYLRRTGDTTNASDAGAWVNLMGTGTTQAVVANGIIRSSEALGYVVDDLYRTILGRDADPAGRSYHVNLLATG